MKPEIPHPIEEETIVEGLESPRYFFDNREGYLSLLEKADVLHQEDLDVARPDLAKLHSNQVYMVEMGVDTSAIHRERNSNSIRFFEVHYGGKPLVALFKPEGGESEYRKREFSITRMYPREYQAYLLDYYAELGIVPPTILREIDGEIGSLQLYTFRIQDFDQQRMESSESWKKMAVLDRLINNCDRKKDNYLARRDNHSEIIAIDHGCSFCLPQKNDANDAYNYFLDNPEKAQLGHQLEQNLRLLLDRQSLVMDASPDDMKHYLDARNGVFARAEAMVESGSLLVN
jgi:hypothetical protein